MFKINEDKSINVTRGDVAEFFVVADEDGSAYIFNENDIVRMKVFEKKDCNNVVLQKDFPAVAGEEKMDILLTSEDTSIGEIISKPTDYWYEIELNPLTNPHTIIGYDEDGAKIFRLYPEGGELKEG